MTAVYYWGDESIIHVATLWLSWRHFVL